MQHRVIRCSLQTQRGSQLTMLSGAHLCFTKSPVLVAHQAQDRKQLRLSEKVFGILAAIVRHDLFGQLKRYGRKATNPTSAMAVLLPLLWSFSQRMSTEPDGL